MLKDQILPVGKVFGLFPCSYKLNYGKELLMSVELFLFFQHQPVRKLVKGLFTFNIWIAKIT